MATIKGFLAAGAAAISPLGARRSGDVGPIARTHTSDLVFQRLAGKILRHELGVGSTLASERALALEFGVSRVLVRAAIHRLASHGFVRVRQGAPTIVLDPDESRDARVVQLEVELAPRTDDDRRELLEWQAMNLLPILALAERRITPAELDELDRVVAEYAAARGTEDALGAFEHEYWSRVARATRNRLYARDVGNWHALVDRRPELRHMVLGTSSQRVSWYRAINEALRSRSDAVLVVIRGHFAALALASAGRR